MKRKFVEYKKALVLRRTGKSIKKIAAILGVSVSIVSVWCRGVELTEEQKEKLKRRKVNIRHLRRLAKQSHLEKIFRVKRLFENSLAEIKSLTDNELFLTGLALYWAEGYKKTRWTLQFSNSDPAMIKLIMRK